LADQSNRKSLPASCRNRFKQLDNRGLSMKMAAPLFVSCLLIVTGIIRFDVVAQDSPEGKRKGTAQPTSEHHRVFRVQTELQRRILGQESSVFVLFERRGVLKDGAPDEPALQSMRRDLERTGTKDGIVRFRMFLDQAADSNQHGLPDALGRVARAAGFQAGTIEEELRNDGLTWRDRLATLDRAHPGLRGGDEPGLGNKFVRIYPVRTRLSYCLLEESDCVVEFLVFPDEEVEDRMRVLIKATLPKLDLGRKEQIQFLVPGDKVPAGSHAQLQERLGLTAKSLGFARSRVSY
jgi:hypothetical protein